MDIINSASNDILSDERKFEIVKKNMDMIYISG